MQYHVGHAFGVLKSMGMVGLIDWKGLDWDFESRKHSIFCFTDINWLLHNLYDKPTPPSSHDRASIPLHWKIP